MRKDAIFIGVEVKDEFRTDAALGAKLEEVCPVSIFRATPGGVDIDEGELDECVLCGLCYDAAPAGAVAVLKLYEDSAPLR